jgi:hypothetical protein
MTSSEAVAVPTSSVLMPESKADSKPIPAEVMAEQGGVRASTGGDGLKSSGKEQTALAILNVLVSVFSIVALSCLGSQIDNRWGDGGSHTSFALFTGITSIFLSAGFFAARVFYLPNASGTGRKVFLYSDLVFNFVYSVFWFATACDIAVQVSDWGSDGRARAQAYAAFAFFASFASIVAAVVAALAIRRESRLGYYGNN